ncbi:hypothetical protein AMTRI_Chr11g97380 [Amborella trichopoda]|uniref:dirigent protein 22 n=1 Tax=Amborella trichopoda TaxID=13333 RepID=UPI0005D3BFD5|nr:dirigent protein 22 [Amborella trichopoda]|eukprot:XP_011622192.1 dirigent protein 22 [Amborella trichopoda]
MAMNLSKPSSMSPLFLLLLTIFFTMTTAQKQDNLPLNFLPEFGLGKENVSHLHFFFHDIVGGPKPTAIRVAEADFTKTSPTGFGAIVMIDDPLTEGPMLSSKLLGRAQGFYASSALEELGFLMTLNYVFVEGEYKGSTLSILGRNPVMNEVREMAVVGGSGAFRFARGYALAKTHSFNDTTGDAVVEYNVEVIHYSSLKTFF